MRPRERGFSLVELLVVIGILLTISAIAIPSYMSAIQRAHEASAVAFLRQVQAAQETFRMANHEYAESFAKLAPYLSAGAFPPQMHFGTSPDVLFAFSLPPQSEKGQGQGPGGTPPGQGGTPPGQGGTPPGQGGTPPGQGGTPPGQGGTPPGHGGSPAGGGGSLSGGAGAATADSLVRSMYIFRLTRTQPLQWQCIAEPVRDRTENKFFYTDSSNVVRYAIGAMPSASSQQL